MNSWLYRITTAAIFISQSVVFGFAQDDTPNQRQLAAARAANRLLTQEAMAAGDYKAAANYASQYVELLGKIYSPGHHQIKHAEWSRDFVRHLAEGTAEERSQFEAHLKTAKDAIMLCHTSNFAEARPLFEKALQQILLACGRNKDNPLVAAAYYNLGENLADQGDYAGAAPFFEQASRIQSDALGDSSPLNLTFLERLALNAFHAGKEVDSKALAARATAIRTKTFGKRKYSALASSYGNQGRSLTSRGFLPLSSKCYQKALSASQLLLGENTYETMVAYENLASNLNLRGQNRLALRLNEKAVAIGAVLYGVDSPEIAPTLNGLAICLTDLGRHAEAQVFQERILRIRSKQAEAGNALSNAHLNLGSCLQDQGKYKAAEENYELAIKRTAPGEPWVNLPDCLNNLGTLQEDTAAAEDKFREALRAAEDLLKSLTDENDRFSVTTATYNIKHNLAFRLLDLGELEESRSTFTEVVNWRRFNLGEFNPNTLSSMEGLASTFLNENKYVEAEKLHDQASIAWERNADSAISGGIVGGLASHYDGFKEYCFVKARLGKFAEAFDLLEQSSGRALLDELVAVRQRGLNGEELLRKNTLENEIGSLEAAVAQIKANSLKAQLPESLTKRLVKARGALSDLLRQLDEKYGIPSGKPFAIKQIQEKLAPATAMVCWADLGPVSHSAVNQNGEHWGIVLRKFGDPIWVDLTKNADGGEWTKTDSALPSQAKSALRSATNGDWKELVHKLRKQRLDPLIPHFGARDGMPRVSRLVVLPSKSMAGFPVDTLLTSEDDLTIIYAPNATVYTHLMQLPPPKSHGALLVGAPDFEETADANPVNRLLPEHGLFVNAVINNSNADKAGIRAGDVLLNFDGTKLATVADLTKAAKAAAQAVIPIVVWRDGKTATRTINSGRLGVALNRKPAPQVFKDRRKVAIEDDSSKFAPLPGAALELSVLAGLFGDASEQLVGPDANELRIQRMAKEKRLSNYRYLHFATHGVINPQLPQLSSIVLSQAGLPDPIRQMVEGKRVYDGRVSVAEIRTNWDLDADLVTFSACETALGRYADGEGYIGFTQALLLSGTRRVCVSLWKVDDAATSLLMGRFYRNLLQQERAGAVSVADALADAKHWLKNLTQLQATEIVAKRLDSIARGKQPTKTKLARPPLKPVPMLDKPYAHPNYWAAFILVGID